MILPLISTAEAASRGKGRVPCDNETREATARLLREVECGGDEAVRRLAHRFDGTLPMARLVYARADFRAALQAIDPRERAALERAAERIRSFAAAQRSAFADLDTPVPGGRAGHRLVPISAAGCYVPGGRYPLPSTLLMTAITARVAGVDRVVIATPKPSQILLAAAAVAGADVMLGIGGAQGIAALAYGFAGEPACDVVCGPGNKWVTAAKELLGDRVRIDLPAGPSELCVIADENADPALVALDLLAQAEHDPEATPALIAFDDRTVKVVRLELERRARGEALLTSLRGGFAVVVEDRAEALELANAMAPEHLALHVDDAKSLLPLVRNAGTVFLGAVGAEAFADYGLGPNHVLPTGGAARRFGALSVLGFLRVQTWVDLAEASPDLVADTVTLAGLEGLAWHATSAAARAAR